MFDFLGDLLGLNQGDPLKEASSLNKKVIGRYDKQGNQIIDAADDRAGGYLEQVMGLYQPYAGATGMYADAVGLNGADGSARAQNAFTTSPGYDFSLNQGLQALERRASSMGSYQSGGTSAGILDYATGRANQEYGSWLDRLGGMSNTALSGQSGALNNLANLATGTGQQRLGLAGDVASGYMAANNQFAEGEGANKKGIAGLGGTLFNMAGKAMGWGGF